MVGQKVGVALAAGLNVIGCIGETLAERQAGQLEEVLTRQIKAIVGTFSELSKLKNGKE